MGPRPLLHVSFSLCDRSFCEWPTGWWQFERFRFINCHLKDWKINITSCTQANLNLGLGANKTTRIFLGSGYDGYAACCLTMRKWKSWRSLAGVDRGRGPLKPPTAGSGSTYVASTHRHTNTLQKNMTYRCRKPIFFPMFFLQKLAFTIEIDCNLWACAGGQPKICAFFAARVSTHRREKKMSSMLGYRKFQTSDMSGKTEWSSPFSEI